jgi:hypothetical protein
MSLTMAANNSKEVALLADFRKLDAIKQRHLLAIVRHMADGSAAREPALRSHLRLIPTYEESKA